MNPATKYYYVYILRSQKDDQWYTGCTADLRKRFTEHNSGKSAHTSKHMPYDLIYYEACVNQKDAFARERYLKSGMGKRYVRNRLKYYFESDVYESR